MLLSDRHAWEYADGLVWVDVSRIKAHKRARYIGQPARAESAG